VSDVVCVNVFDLPHENVDLRLLYANMALLCLFGRVRVDVFF
jgi:hypothetical protein